jgi:CTP:molybdopterin cytidylyltransferase MocA
MIPAIVLAAGASSRMGQPKALLPLRGRSFVRTIVETLRLAGIERIVVVIRPDAAAVAAEIEAVAGARAVVNPAPERGQLSSLLVGIDAIDGPGVDGALVTLVDVPLPGARTVTTLLERAAVSQHPIVRAVHRGRHGHPVIFKRELFEALRRADPAAGAKPVVRAHGVDDVEVDDPGVAEDVDTPGDYDRLVT